MVELQINCSSSLRSAPEQHQGNVYNNLLQGSLVRHGNGQPCVQKGFEGKKSHLTWQATFVSPQKTLHKAAILLTIGLVFGIK